MMSKVGFDDRVYSLNVISTIVESLAREGVPESEALSGAHLTPRALHSPDTRVSINQRIQVCRNALRLSRDPHFAYHTGLRIHVSTYGMFGFAIISSSTIRKGIDFAVRYQQLGGPLVDVSFREEDRRGIWSLMPIAHPGMDRELSRFVLELYTSLIISLHRDGAGASFAPLEIHLTFDPPEDAEIYEDMMGCPVLFKQKQGKVIFDSAWLDREPAFRDEHAHYETAKLCESLMDELQLRTGIAGKVRERLMLNHLRPTSCAAIARQLHMTERTLRRKLREEQTSFQVVFQELRMQMGVKYLRDTDLTVDDIAHALGFSEDASFRRAFRRWANAAPLQFRVRLKDGTEPRAPTA